MPQSQRCPASDSHARAESTVRPLSRRYLVVVALVAALVLLDQAILQPLLVQLNFSAPAINLAGRQRMLSQKVSKEALAAEFAIADEARHSQRRNLRESLDQWASAHRALLEGDVDRGVQPVNDSAAAMMREIEPAFETIQRAAREILANDSPPRDAGKSAAATRILELEPKYLQGMERVVTMLETSAHERVAWLRACGLVAALAIVALLIGVYFLVLQPATQLIRGQVEMLTEARDTLELRVSQRTAELVAANSALQHEMNERQDVELRMRSLSAELAHASRVTALGQLATGLAHEINQPLATVANYAGTLELALDRACPEEAEPRALVAQIKQAALRAGDIVRRMRNFVRRGEVQAMPVDLNVLVTEVIELCRAELRYAEVELTLDLAPQSVLASVDAVQIQQVLVNLINNAIQAMADSPVRALRVCTQCGPNEVTVEVCDTGPGLPVEVIEQCFQPFHSSKRDGLGLGLAISRNIIEQHQGRIWSENRERGGAIIGFRLPSLHAHDITFEQLAHGLRG
jgi:two-component system sensor kinase FixL